MLKLKLQYFVYLKRTVDSGKDPEALKTEGKRRKGQQRMRWLDGITDLMDMNCTQGDSEVQGIMVCCSSWGHKESDKTCQLNNNNI